MSDYSTLDLVNFAAENKPDQFRSAFNELIADKIANAIEARKQEVAQNYLSDDDEEVVDDETQQEVTDGQDA